jgi:hypothetical protein
MSSPLSSQELANINPSSIPLLGSRDSLDYPRPSSLSNGLASLTLDPIPEGAQPPLSEDANARIQGLEEELGRTRGEKEAFEAQYRSLLAKLTTMRNTLGDKLKQDAVSCWLFTICLAGGGAL